MNSQKLSETALPLPQQFARDMPHAVTRVTLGGLGNDEKAAGRRRRYQRNHTAWAASRRSRVRASTYRPQVDGFGSDGRSCDVATLRAAGTAAQRHRQALGANVGEFSPGAARH